MRLTAPDEVRWFESLGICHCGKPAQGTLRGPRNDSYGVACTRCGEARVKRAQAEREAFAKATGSAS